jgi:hypothetical protein
MKPRPNTRSYCAMLASLYCCVSRNVRYSGARGCGVTTCVASRGARGAVRCGAAGRARWRRGLRVCVLGGGGGSTAAGRVCVCVCQCVCAGVGWQGRARARRHRPHHKVARTHAAVGEQTPHAPPTPAHAHAHTHTHTRTQTHTHTHTFVNFQQIWFWFLFTVTYVSTHLQQTSSKCALVRSGPGSSMASNMAK